MDTWRRSDRELDYHLRNLESWNAGACLRMRRVDDLASDLQSLRLSGRMRKIEGDAGVSTAAWQRGLGSDHEATYLVSA